MRSVNIIATTLLLSASLAAGADEITQSGFSPLYIGVEYETATIPNNPIATGAPTTSRAYIARIDLRAPGIGFIATPHSGSLDTISETTSQFAAAHRVRLAINTNFFAPCCNAAPEPKTVIGLLVSQGNIVSPPTSDPLKSEAVLAITRYNRAVIAEAPEVDLTDVYTAVAGSAIIVKDGVDVSASSPAEGDPFHPNPRTLIGLSRDGRFLYLAVIDGRVAGYSLGTTNAQSAALMIAIGAYTALNLDGGGSSELVRADKLGSPYILSNPSGGTERYDAAALGVYALPLERRHGWEDDGFESVADAFAP